MDNLNKLDFEVSYDTSFSREGRDLINIYSKKVDMIEAKEEEDKLIKFSVNLANCFKDKVRKSPERLRVDSLIATYKAAGETYNKEMDCSLGECNLNIDSAKQDLLDYNLDIDFDSVDQLYIETRKETISNAIASHWMGI
jgi:hypothetical protein